MGPCITNPETAAEGSRCRLAIGGETCFPPGIGGLFSVDAEGEGPGAFPPGIGSRHRPRPNLERGSGGDPDVDSPAYWHRGQQPALVSGDGPGAPRDREPGYRRLHPGIEFAGQ